LGYVLRYAEINLFPCATTLRGLDIDRYAVERGSAYLHCLGSKIQLTTADIADADRIMGDQNYDVILCCGVLMYLDEYAATQVVKTMLSHAKYLVGIICLAHPEIDNATLNHSEVRPSDGALAHNLDRMIHCNGGKVVLRRWGGMQTRSGSPAYIILAEPCQS
jgi:2-polyprenyl-3-methyl-5-hydroxy-6-metoxy-1,4-benzoquinol methylase